MPPQPDRYVAIVGSDGEPDMSVAIVGDQVVDLSGAEPGQVLVVQPDGTLALGTAPGTGLDRSVNGDVVNFGVAEVDLLVVIEVDVPEDRDVEIRAKVPTVGSATAAAIITVKLCDEANTQIQAESARSSTASRNHPPLIFSEVLPAGSGTVTRKLRAVASAATGSDAYINLAGGSEIVLDAIAR